MSAQTDSPEVRLLVSIEKPQYSGDGVFWVIARPVHIVTDGGTERVRNISSHSSWDPNGELADLEVRVMVDAERWYSYETEYRDVYEVDLARARMMVKLLSKVERGLEKLEREFGFAESYAAYVARVGKVLGITQFGFKTGGDDRWHDTNEYRWVDATYLRDLIEGRVDQQRQAMAR